ncbi:MAG: PKD domain-containing protein [Thermoplasmatota archaeon]
MAQEMRSSPAVLVLLLALSTGAPLAALELEPVSSGSGESQGDGFGASVTAGDINGDGFDDLLVGAPQSDAGGADAGSVYIFYGPIDSSTGEISAGAADAVITGMAPGALFGQSISARGDINGDSVDDVVVGAPGHMSGRGAAFVFFGGELDSRSAEAANATLLGSEPGQALGRSVSIAGDLNGDGIDDLALGAPGARWGGEAMVLFGRALSGATLYPDLRELPQDRPQPLDFTSGLNYTGNTFYLSGEDDGWDWAAGVYGGDDPDARFILPDGASEAALHVSLGGGTSGGGPGNNNPPASGGFGVEFSITDAMSSQIRNGSSALLALDWELLDETGLEAWDGEVVWLKVCLSNSYGRHYLGTSLDGDSQPQDDDLAASSSDGTSEVYFYDWADGSSRRVLGSCFLDVSSYLSMPGQYYLDMGAKLGDWSHEGELVHIYFDNITLLITPLHRPDAELHSPCSPGFGGLVAGSGDINGDGLDDLLVGGGCDGRAFLYYGSPRLGPEFELRWASITPRAKNPSDTTDEPLSRVQSDDNDYYRVLRGRVMWLDGFGAYGLSGVLHNASLYCSFRVRAGVWYESYSGTGRIRIALPPGPLTNTSLQPWHTTAEALAGPLDLMAAGATSIEALGSLQVEFTNSDGGSRDDWVEFDVIYIVLAFSAAPNATLSGPPSSLFGHSAARLGDLNGDGYGELAVGAPNASAGRGAVFVFQGAPGLKDALNESDASARITGTSNSGRFGEALASGAISFDSALDLVIGAPGTRRVYLFRGGPTLNDARADQADGWLEAGGPDGLFGASLCAVDLDGLGCADVAAGAPGERGTGWVYLFRNVDERIISAPLDVSFLPAHDPTIRETESQVFCYTVLNPAGELKVRPQWYLDGDLLDGENGGAYIYSSDHTSSGHHDVEVRLTDGRRTALHSWRLLVLDVNAPPEVRWWPGCEVEMDEGSTVTLTADAVDVDGDALTFTWELDGSGLNHTLPKYDFGPGFSSSGTHRVSCAVEDGRGHSVSREWTIAVRDVNRPPVIDLAKPELESVSVLEGEGVSFSILAHDPDGDDVAVVWLWDGAQLAFDTPEFHLQADHQSAGTGSVRVVVSDGVLTTSRHWTVTILDVNAPPIVTDFSPRGDVRLNEGETASFWVVAQDPDGDVLTVSWHLDGELVDQGTLWFRFTGSQGSLGAHIVQAAVSDGSHTVLRNWTVLVNHAPRISVWSPRDEVAAIHRGETRLFFVTAVDADSDPLETSWYLDGGLLAGTSGNSIRLSAGLCPPGVHRLRAIVSDGALGDAHEWSVDVIAGSLEPPYPVLELRPRNPRAGEEVVVSALGSRDDGEIVNYIWEFGDGSLAYGATAAHVYSKPGTYIVTLTLTDGDGNLATATEMLAVGPPREGGGEGADWGPAAAIALAALLAFLFPIALLQRRSLKRLEAEGKGERPGDPSSEP